MPGVREGQPPLSPSSPIAGSQPPPDHPSAGFPSGSPLQNVGGEQAAGGADPEAEGQADAVAGEAAVQVAPGPECGRRAGRLPHGPVRLGSVRFCSPGPWTRAPACWRCRAGAPGPAIGSAGRAGEGGPGGEVSGPRGPHPRRYCRGSGRPGREREADPQRPERGAAFWHKGCGARTRPEPPRLLSQSN